MPGVHTTLSPSAWTHEREDGVGSSETCVLGSLSPSAATSTRMGATNTDFTTGGETLVGAIRKGGEVFYLLSFLGT